MIKIVQELGPPVASEKPSIGAEIQIDTVESLSKESYSHLNDRRI